MFLLDRMRAILVFYKHEQCSNFSLICQAEPVGLVLMHASESQMRSPRLIQRCCVGLRFLRYKFHPWIMLAIASLKLLIVSGLDRTHEKIRCMQAMSKIDFANVYSLLNDLLW